MGNESARTNRQWPLRPQQATPKRKLKNTQPDGVDSLRVSVAEIDKAFGESNPEPGEDQGRRSHERYKSLGLLKMVVEIIQPGGTSAPLVVHGHNLGSGGAGIVHGQYLYPGSKCKCWIRRADGTAMSIMGELRWCSHIKGKVHVSGVQFAKPIDINEFQLWPLHDQSIADDQAQAQEAANVEAETGSGTQTESQAAVATVGQPEPEPEYLHVEEPIPAAAAEALDAYEKTARS